MLPTIAEDSFSLPFPCRPRKKYVTAFEQMVKSQTEVSSCRTSSTSSKISDLIFLKNDSEKIWTKGRPPWYDNEGKTLEETFFIGVCGGSASGKTTIAENIVKKLELPWVTFLSMDSFYKPLNAVEHELALEGKHNFDTPDALDFDLFYDVLCRLKNGKSVEIPVYDFITHKRKNDWTSYYGADVIICEGIFLFHDERVRSLLNIKIFIQAHPTICKTRRAKRDAKERNIDHEKTYEQFVNCVQPAYEKFIKPAADFATFKIISKDESDEIEKAIDVIVCSIKAELTKRGYGCETASNLLNNVKINELPLPKSFSILEETPEISLIKEMICCNKTPRNKVIFYLEQLMRKHICVAWDMNCFTDTEITVSNGMTYYGKSKVNDWAGIIVERAGQTIERSFRVGICCHYDSLTKNPLGIISIQTNSESSVPKFFFREFPQNLSKALVMDATVSTGSCALMAIKVLMDHDVLEENIMICALSMKTEGIQRIAYIFPKVKLFTAFVDSEIVQNIHNFDNQIFDEAETESIYFSCKGDD